MPVLALLSLTALFPFYHENTPVRLSVFITPWNSSCQHHCWTSCCLCEELIVITHLTWPISSWWATSWSLRFFTWCPECLSLLVYPTSRLLLLSLVSFLLFTSLVKSCLLNTASLITLFVLLPSPLHHTHLLPFCFSAQKLLSAIYCHDVFIVCLPWLEHKVHGGRNVCLFCCLLLYP